MLSSHKSLKCAVTAIAVVAAMMLASGAAQAVIINVPGDQPTIQAAINAAVNGDEVVVAPGVYTENLTLLGKAITVRSAAGPEVTSIDGGQVRSVVRFENGEGADTVVLGFTITNGIGEGNVNGGGIFISGSSPRIENCRIAGNFVLGQAGNGAGIYVLQGSPTIKNCVVTGNFMDGRGGGIYDSGDTPQASVVGCLIAGNSARLGGGVFGDSILVGCTIRFNTASQSGTGIFSNAIAELQDSVICSNWGVATEESDIIGAFIDLGGNTIVAKCPAECEPPNPFPADTTGPGGVPDGCVDGNDLAKLLGEWCSVAGGNPCGTCGP